MGVLDRLKHGWNAFLSKDDEDPMNFWSGGASYGSPPDRRRTHIGSERTIISSIYTRISIDVASVDMRHVRLDDQGRYTEDIKSGLNECLSVEANIDQGARDFMQNVALSLFASGVIAIVPVDTTEDPRKPGSWDIKTIRVGEVVEWFPQSVRVKLWNDQKGIFQEKILPKRFVAIVYNPLYSVMNEPNSTLQRLTRKLSMLDTVDEASSSGKLDLIIQLPYVVKSDAMKDRAEARRKDIEFQLKGSQYGIAYADGTEKITQLNRPAENNLLKQIEYLHTRLYAELGLTAAVMDGTADEAAMLNYNNRTIEPILGAIAEGILRKFLTKTARSQGQSIMYFRDPFKLVPMKDLAELADKFTRNEIVSSNEFRGFIGMKRSEDPKADELRNSNMPQSELGVEEEGADDPAVQGVFAGVNDTLDGIFRDLGVDE